MGMKTILKLIVLLDYNKVSSGKREHCIITIAANIAETGLLGFDACFPDSIIGFVTKSKICHYRICLLLFKFNKDYLANKSYGSAQDNLNLSTFSSLKIPVPSLEIQSRIVQVLDNFDTVCNDLKSDFPGR